MKVLKCKICGKYFKGGRAVSKHKRETGHDEFEFIKRVVS